MTEKLLKKYKRKNELHAPFTAQCACSLTIFNQKIGVDAILNLINVLFVASPTLTQSDILMANLIAASVSLFVVKKRMN